MKQQPEDFLNNKTSFLGVLLEIFLLGLNFTYIVEGFVNQIVKKSMINSELVTNKKLQSLHLHFCETEQPFRVSSASSWKYKVGYIN